MYVAVFQANNFNNLFTGDLTSHIFFSCFVEAWLLVLRDEWYNILKQIQLINVTPFSSEVEEKHRELVLDPKRIKKGICQED